MTGPTTVLVASADDDVRAQVRLTLGDERFLVHDAEDTAAAVEALVEHQPDLLVVDLGLPGRGALALAGSVRAQPETAGTRTLVLVPRGQQVPTDAAGVDATLAVPATPFAMLRRIDGLVAG